MDMNKVLLGRKITQKEKEFLFWDKYWLDRIKYFKKRGDIFESKFRWGYYINQKLHEHYKEIIGDFSKLKIMECGSGSGFNSCLMATEGADVTVIDISPRSIQYIKIVAGKFGLKDKLNYYCGDFDAYTSPEKFDVIFSGGLLEHYSDKQIIKILKKMKCQLNPGGKIIATLPNLRSLEGVFRLSRSFFKRERRSERFISYEKLICLMREAGLENVKVIPLNFFLPSFFPGSMANMISKINLTKYLRSLTWLFSGVGEIKKGEQDAKR